MEKPIFDDSDQARVNVSNRLLELAGMLSTSTLEAIIADLDGWKGWLPDAMRAAAQDRMVRRHRDYRK